jgi:hypothetical protein
LLRSHLASDSPLDDLDIVYLRHHRSSLGFLPALSMLTRQGM